MKTCLLQLQTLLDTFQVPLGDRAEVIFSTAARALAYKLPLPSSPVENPYAYFLDKYRDEVMSDLAVLNETTVIRINEAAQLAKHLWVFRYHVVYDPTSISVMQALDVLATQEGERYLAPTYKKILAKHADVFLGASRIFNDALAKPNLAEV
jgi:hypothetical protein